MSKILILLICLTSLPSSGSDFHAGIEAYNQMQYEKAWEILGPLAEKGDAKAQLWVGILYLMGKGVPVNFSLGYKWLLRAESVYYTETGRLIEWVESRMTEEDIASIRIFAYDDLADDHNISWLCQAAMDGDADAQYHIGKIFSNPKWKPDYLRAAVWFGRAADQGHVDAQFWLGLLYDAGLGLTENNRAARCWYKIAADQGHKDALVMLGSIYLQGNGVPRDPLAAVLYLKKAAFQGHPIAQYALGSMYVYGDGIPVNSETGLKWLVLAAQKEDCDAQLLLGSMYWLGRGVQQNRAEAISWFKQAAEKGDASAYYYLGELFQENSGSTESLRESVQCYQKAAAQGVPEAHLALAKIYMSGFRLRSDCIKAYTWATLAAAGNNEPIRFKAKEIMGELQKTMLLPDVLKAQREAYRYWNELGHH
ncbi:sel1 repeat family protein [candidate division KSB1 bacterium]|nr:sel1 repeat family protein [candidate division KSB1 bacterium]